MISEETTVSEYLTVGLPPLVKDWLLHSNTPLAEEWRNKFKLYAARQIEAARRRQLKIHEELKASPPINGKHIRKIAVIDPVIADDMRSRYGSNCWNDRAFIADTRKKAPELFVPK